MFISPIKRLAYQGYLFFSVVVCTSFLLFVPQVSSAAVIYSQLSNIATSTNTTMSFWKLPAGTSAPNGVKYIDLEASAGAASHEFQAIIICRRFSDYTGSCPEMPDFYTYTSTQPVTSTSTIYHMPFTTGQTVELSSSRFYAFGISRTAGSSHGIELKGVTTTNTCIITGCGISGTPYVVLYNATPITSNISTSTTFESGEVYEITGDITVNSGVTLTVQPGAIVKFAASSSLAVTGNLIAAGTATSTIYFTSLQDDSVGGDTNADSASTTPAAGDWGNIKVNAGGIVSVAHAIIRYGGDNSEGLVRNNGGQLQLISSVIATSSSYGVLTDSASSTNSVSATDIFGNSRGYFSSDGYTSIHASSSVRDNTNGIYVTGGLVEVTYSRVFDNTNYGVYTEAAFELDVSEISDNLYGVYVNGGSANSIDIASSHIHDNTYGVYINNGNASIGSNSIEGNSTYGVYKVTSGDAPATYNYWGASDGPDGAGPGSGDDVSTNVNYYNFLSEAHFILVNHNGNRYSSVNNDQNPFDGMYDIDWSGNPAPYASEWNSAVTYWNTLGGVTIAEDGLLSDIDLLVSTTSADDLAWSAQWSDYPSDEDQIILNDHYLREDDSDIKLNVILHELGHALGLAHSFPGNIMHYTESSATSTGDQDLSDYNYLWP